MEAQLSIVMISSPASRHPSTCIIEEALASFNLIPELSNCRIIIVLDGYILSDENRTKKGRITKELAQNYENYYIALQSLISKQSKPLSREYSIERLSCHHGFAMAVRAGLLLCRSKYCLISQHDRAFISNITCIEKLLNIMDEAPYIRYIGFPTSTNCSHKCVLKSRYKLDCLNDRDMTIPVEVDEVDGEHETVVIKSILQPVIFWFDSQHIAHVQRYLDIYSPFTKSPPIMKSLLGNHFFRDMVMRSGDFIEDRFGQMQRKCLTEISSRSDPPVDVQVIKEIFKWFGSYLYWVPDKLFSKVDDELIKNSSVQLSMGSKLQLRTDPFSENVAAKVMVGHLRGRQRTSREPEFEILKQSRLGRLHSMEDEVVDRVEDIDNLPFDLFLSEEDD